jgi:hypothetical protein
MCRHIQTFLFVGWVFLLCSYLRGEKGVGGDIRVVFFLWLRKILLCALFWGLVWDTQSV